MTRTHLFSGAALTVAALALASCGSSSGSGGSSSTAASQGAGAAAPATGGALVRATKTPLGTVLADGGGRTLYAFARDTGPRSTCVSDCAMNWPPFTTSALPKTAGGVQASQLSLVKRSDGARQVAIAGHPLYFFEGDRSAGQFNGQGLDAFGARWWLVSPSGMAVTGPPSSPSSPSGGAGARAASGYGY